MQINQQSQMSIGIPKDIRQSYQGFHSERNPHDQNVLEQHYQMSIQCPIHHPVQSILKALRLALRQNNYKGVEVFESSMFIVRMKWTDRIKKIFICQEPPKYIIRLQTREYASTRSLTLKSLNQNSNEFEMRLILNILQKAMPPPPPPRDQEYKQDIYSLDATATYMFHKILLNQKYSLGKKMHQLLKYSEQAQPTQALQPPPIIILQNMGSDKLDWINNVLHEIANDMLEGFNCSRKELIEILGFCRKTVEEFYYNSLIQKQANKLEHIEFEEYILSTKVPLTEKELIKLSLCNSGPSILRQLFFLNHTFYFETTKLSLTQEQKNEASKSLQAKYQGVMKQKIKMMKSTQYREQFRHYLQDFQC